MIESKTINLIMFNLMTVNSILIDLLTIKLIELLTEKLIESFVAFEKFVVD